MSLRNVIVSGVCFCILANSCLLVTSHDPPQPRKLKIAPTLNNAFDTDESTKKNVVVNFRQKPSSALNLFDMSGKSQGMSIEAAQIQLHTSFLEKLKVMQLESQGEVLRFLEGEAPNNHKSFWITNQIFVKDASKELCEALGSFDNVESIQEEQIFHIHKPLEEGPVVDETRKKETKAGLNKDNIEWNIEKVRAREAEQMGEGRTCSVGIIDTGIRSSHEAFDDIEVFAWFDAIKGKSSPYDDNGHGSHVAGIIAGGNGIGVAPASTRLACCKACTGDGQCPQSALTDCCQFMTELKPNVVSNSWGGPAGTEAPYTEVIKSWKALNIAGVFSAGNEGPKCSSVGSPGDTFNVISVGSTTISDSLSDFSSRGQCQSGLVAPTVSAPGGNINSAWMSSDTAYKAISGTSMAAPHVSGLYAIVWSQNPGISFDQAKKAIISSCITSGLADPKQTCGGTSHKQVPNNMYGFGRIDCVNALQFLSEQKVSSENANN